MDELALLSDHSFCYVTTTGRRSGSPHEIEIWFGWAEGATIYLMAGGRERADWVRNMQADPSVTVRIGDSTFRGTSRIVSERDEGTRARRLLAAKYQGWRKGQEMSGWAQSALVVAIELEI